MGKYAITSDAATNEIAIVDFDEANSYKQLQAATGGGLIQCVSIDSLGIDLWIDDEGKLVENPRMNVFGTALWIHEYGMTDMIVGDIIITGGIDDEGNTLAIDSLEKAAEIIEAAKAATSSILDGSYLRSLFPDVE